MEKITSKYLKILGKATRMKPSTVEKIAFLKITKETGLGEILLAAFATELVICFLIQLVAFYIVSLILPPQYNDIVYVGCTCLSLSLILVWTILMVSLHSEE